MEHDLQQGNLILIPQEIFVGDTAQLRYTLKGTTNLLKEDGDSITVQESDSKLTQTQSCTITSASITKDKDSSLTVVVLFTPWETGTVHIPAIDFGTNTAPLVVSFPPIHISSLAEKTQTTTLMPPASPLLIPGTSYFLYGAVVSIFIFLLLLIIACIKIKSFSRSISSLLARLLQTRNFKQLKQRLRKLAKRQKKYESVPFAHCLQHILRTYFTGRFKQDFSSATSHEVLFLLQKFQNHYVAQDFATIDLKQRAQEQSEQFSTTIEETKLILTRLDFVRFASQKEQSTQLSEQERLALVSAIETIATECEDVSI